MRDIAFFKNLNSVVMFRIIFTLLLLGIILEVNGQNRVRITDKKKDGIPDECTIHISEYYDFRFTKEFDVGFYTNYSNNRRGPRPASDPFSCKESFILVAYIDKLEFGNILGNTEIFNITDFELLTNGPDRACGDKGDYYYGISVTLNGNYISEENLCEVGRPSIYVALLETDGILIVIPPVETCFQTCEDDNTIMSFPLKKACCEDSGLGNQQIVVGGKSFISDIGFEAINIEIFDLAGNPVDFKLYENVIEILTDLKGIYLFRWKEANTIVHRKIYF